MYNGISKNNKFEPSKFKTKIWFGMSDDSRGT